MKILPIPVLKIEQKSIQVKNAVSLKAIALFLICLAIIILLFSKFYISSICLGVIAVINIRSYQFLKEINSIDWTSEQYQIPLESIIDDLEGC